MLSSLYNYLPSIDSVTSYFSASESQPESKELLSVNSTEPQVPISGITKISWLQNFSSASVQLTGSMVLSPIYIAETTTTSAWSCPPANELLSAFGGPVYAGADSQVQVGDVFGVLVVNDGSGIATFTANASGGTGDPVTVGIGKQQTIWFLITSITVGSQSYKLLSIAN